MDIFLSFLEELRNPFPSGLFQLARCIWAVLAQGIHSQRPISTKRTEFYKTPLAHKAGGLSGKGFVCLLKGH